MPSMTKSHMSGRQWGKPWLRWTAFPVPNPNPALPQPGLGTTLTVKPCLPQSVQSPTAALGRGAAQNQGAPAQGAVPLGVPMLMRAPPVQGQTWVQHLRPSRMLGTALVRTLGGAMRPSPCRTVCGLGRAPTEGGQPTRLLVWTGTCLLSLDPYKRMTAMIHECKSMQVAVHCAAPLNWDTKLICMPEGLSCHGVVMTARLPLSQF